MFFFPRLKVSKCFNSPGVRSYANMADINGILRSDQQRLEAKEGNVTIRVDTSSSQCNRMMEDAHAVAEYGAGKKGGKRDFFVGVFDGHNGWMCADMLSKCLSHHIEGVGGRASLHEKAKEMKKGCEKFDEQLSKTSIKLFRTFAESRNENKLRWVYALMKSGSCATFGHISVNGSGSNGDDVGDIVIGNVGDCRAVLGWRKDNQSPYRAIRLTDDHTLKNNREWERYKSEHPGERLERHRVLGCLMPCRVFGDFDYKWTEKEFKKLEAWGIKKRFEAKSPPYVTCEPEVTGVRFVRRGGEAEQEAITQLSTLGPSVPFPPDQGKFVHAPEGSFMIFASDGLWDALSPEEAVAAVQEWMEPKASEDDNEDEDGDDADRWLRSWLKPQDGDNAATNLIRLALMKEAANASPGQIDKLIPNFVYLVTRPNRNFRDDITAVVVFIGPDKVREGDETEAIKTDKELSMTKPVKARCEMVHSKL